VPTNSHPKDWPYFKTDTCDSDLDCSFGTVQAKQWKRDVRFGTWNVRSLYRSGSLTTAARELARYKLDLLDVQEVSWDNGGTVRVGDIFFP
jgi:hypothetical protein